MQALGAALLILFVTILAYTFFVMLGWSMFMVPVFGLKAITFFQALGLSILTAVFRSGGVTTTTTK